VGKIISESYYYAIVLDPEHPNFDLLRKRYPTVMRFIEELIKDNTCPFCKKRFKTRYALYNHIKSSKRCSMVLRTLIEKLMERAEEDELLLYVL